MFSYSEEIISILYIRFQRIEKEETLPNSVYEVCITLLKKCTWIKNWRPISLMNIDTKIFNKILENKIQHWIKRIIHHKHKLNLFQIYKAGLNSWKSINIIHQAKKRNQQAKKENHMIVSKDAEKRIRQNPSLQYSCLENSVDRGAWWARVHGVAKSRTWLSD